MSGLNCARHGAFSAVLLAAWACAAPLPATAPALDERQLQVAYSEAQLIGAVQYTYLAKAYSSEAAARAGYDQLAWQRRPEAAAKLGFPQTTAYAFLIPAALRTALRNLPDARPSPPFLMDDQWWIAVRANTKFDGVPPFDAVKGQLAEAVRTGAIPAPADAVRPPLNAQFLAAGIASPDALSRLPAQFDLDAVLVHGDTLLTRSLILNKPDLTRALLERGASPNRCASTFCPLPLAMNSPDGIKTVELLLAHGADPNALDRAAGAYWSPLTHAMLAPNGPAIARLLLEHGADVNGGDSDVPPLHVAVERGNRALVSILDEHGADWLRRPNDRLLIFGSVLDAAARGSGDAAFKDWIQTRWQAGVDRSGRYPWQGWIEQGGKRIPIAEGPITLARAPFDVVVRLKPGVTLALATSTTDEVYRELEKGPQAGRIFSSAALGAEQRDGSSKFLSVNPPSSAASPGPYGLQGWVQEADATRFTKVRDVHGVTEYVRTVSEFADLSDPKYAITPIEASTYPSLYIVMGTLVGTTFPNFAYYQPHRVQLIFR